MSSKAYDLKSGGDSPLVPAPGLAYRPREGVGRKIGLALVGCGGIARTHLDAYRTAGFQVRVLCSREAGRAAVLQQEFFPAARIETNFEKVLRCDDVQVVDLTAHPGPRAAQIGAALDAGRHVLSQKPFVTDLDLGLKLVEKARAKKLVLAVNQNGRWAPHWVYLRELVRGGYLGELVSARLNTAWDHNWIRDREFNRIQHILLYDFGIHWFDFLASVFSSRAQRVCASVARSPSQQAAPPLLGQVWIDYPGAQASLAFDADTRYGPDCRSLLIGSRGSALAEGPDITQQRVRGFTASGMFEPALEGTWFPGGFHGAMAELLHAVETGATPLNSAEANLESLALCFAAVHSADTHQPVEPWSVRRLPEVSGGR